MAKLQQTVLRCDRLLGGSRGLVDKGTSPWNQRLQARVLPGSLPLCSLGCRARGGAGLGRRTSDAGRTAIAEARGVARSAARDGP